MQGVVPHSCMWAVEPEHGVEGDILQHSDNRHRKHVGDHAKGWLRHPAFLFLHQPQQRDDGRLLASFRKLGGPPFGLLERLVREGEGVRLFF
jgi:hypothetical protein